MTRVADTYVTFPPGKWQISLQYTAPDGEVHTVTVHELRVRDSEDVSFKTVEHHEDDILAGSLTRVHTRPDTYLTLEMHGLLLPNEDGELYRFQSPAKPITVTPYLHGEKPDDEDLYGTSKRCRVCGRENNDRASIYRNEVWCSERHRKILDGEVEASSVENEMWARTMNLFLDIKLQEAGAKLAEELRLEDDPLHKDEEVCTAKHPVTGHGCVKIDKGHEVHRAMGVLRMQSFGPGIQEGSDG